MGEGLRKATAKEWTREEVWEAVKGILIDSLGVDEQEVVPEASLVRDLGAESIDFLDIGFRLQQTFGVSLPTSEIQERIMIWRNRLFSELLGILEARYGIVISPEEMRSFNPLGIQTVLENLAEERGVGVAEGDPVEVARDLTERLAKEVQTLGLEVSEEDKKAIVDSMLADLTSRDIVERILRMFTGEFLVRFIATNLGGDRGGAL
ncbi:MAG: hypothetical protein HY347_00685 [candidate division NC10 bacterium]|nr:hypothetical protein [candidate division NC10 bacterium]